ncbi:transposase [Streptomyces sp. NBC_00490]|uniref:transposase n=1 Tax=Streptomyces sp. NBC_00490 TaxID=2903657 RepID=UPI003FCD58E5
MGDFLSAGSGGQARGRPAKHTRREILNALVYWWRAGCAWRLLPHELPPGQTVYHYWRRWQQEGVWEVMLMALRERERAQLGRDPTPSAAAVDSQSVLLATDAAQRIPRSHPPGARPALCGHDCPPERGSSPSSTIRGRLAFGLPKAPSPGRLTRDAAGGAIHS